MVEVTFWYSNMNSIKNKIDEWKISIQQHKPTFILLTETWLNDQVTDGLIALQGYRIFRKDRMNREGGGILIYVKESVGEIQIHSSPEVKYQTPVPVESLWVKVVIQKTELLLGCIYRPDYVDQETNTEYIRIIEEAFTKSCKTILFGDFNYREINWNSLRLSSSNLLAEELLESYKNLNMHQLVTFPTRIRGDQESLLDLVLVNEKNLLYKLQSHHPVGKSDHIVITCASQLKSKGRDTYKTKKRNFWKADYKTVNEHLLKQNFNNAGGNKTRCEQYEDIITTTIETFIPLRTVKKNPAKPWINWVIFREIDKKRKFWDNYRQNKTDGGYQIYRQQNNKLKKLIIEARKKYERDLLDSESDKQFFKYIGRTLNSKVNFITLKDNITNNVITDNEDIAERFAIQFERMFTVENDQLPDLPESAKIRNTIETIEFTPSKIEEAIGSLKVDSSPGPDNIPAVFLKNCSRVLSTPLSFAMAESMTTGILPLSWTQAIISPIFKKGDRYSPENYRPVSLTSTTCKVMEKVIVKELTGFLSVNEVIPDSQHGFQPRKSTVTNLLTCLNDWTREQDKGKATDIIYLDFEKAFDKVPFKKLLYKLNHNGIRGSLNTWIGSFVQNRVYRVRVNGVFSPCHDVLSGVPQGSVLGPLLFLVYISDLGKNAKTNITFFADDTKLYCDSAQQCNDMNEDLKSVETWADAWQMKLNVSKCAVLGLGSNNPNNLYHLYGSQLQRAQDQRDLGVTISADLKWEKHITSIVKRANSLIYLSKIAFLNASPQMILKLYKTYIRPKLEYAQSVWNPYYKKDKDLIEKVQRRVTKMPHELREDSYLDRLRKLGLTTLEQRRLRGDLIETFKILNNHYSGNPQIFTFNPNQQLRGHTKKLYKERTNKLPRRNFLTNRVVYVWNSLSEEVVSAVSVNSFKNQIDSLGIITNENFVHYVQ